MGRKPCCDKIGLKRGPWTIEEDHKLMSFIMNNGIQCWRMVPKLAGLLRCGKSCRLRWINYLRPDLKRGAFTEMEENQIIELHARLGNRWSKIASHFSGRTDNEIKNHWNTRIKKRLKLLGLDPITHQPIEQNEEEKAEINAQILQEEPKADIITINTDNLTSCEMMCRSAYSPSIVSLEDSVSFHNSMGDQYEENSGLQQWFESGDSLLYWNGICEVLDQSLFFEKMRE